jgi:MFS superfamily sulfate permease-like transporter
MANSFLTFPSLASANRDIPAGIVVFLVALPLCLGIALASGAPLFSGVIAGVVGGVVVSLLSGSELSVSGPAAGLAVIVAAAIIELGSFQTFAVAVVLSGVIQMGLGIARAGMIGDYIPNCVIKGMLAAIGFVIILKQIPHALGDDHELEGSEGFSDAAFSSVSGSNTFSDVWVALMSPSPGAILISVIGLVLLLAWDRPFVKKQAWSKLVPGPLLVVLIGVAINEALGVYMPEWKLTAREHLVTLPVPGSPAEFFGMFSVPDFGAALRADVWIVAATIAIVGSIETLLCIEATDKLDPEKRISDSNRELRAQGIGNACSGLLGGLPITSVIVRSSANIYSGARSRLSGFIHGVVMLLAVALLAAQLNRVPLAALAVVLIVVGYKLASHKIIAEMWARGWTQFIPFMVTLVAIVLTDLLKGIAVGLLTGVFFVIRSNHHASLTLVNEGENWLLRFNKDMSFVNKAELKRQLRSVPDNARLLVDGTKSLYVDNDIYETLKEFETAASYRGIRLEYHHFFDKQLVTRTT